MKSSKAKWTKYSGPVVVLTWIIPWCPLECSNERPTWHPFTSYAPPTAPGTLHLLQHLAGGKAARLTQGKPVTLLSPNVVHRYRGNKTVV